MNSLKNSATNVAPHFVLTGRKPEIGLPEIERKLTHTSDPKSYAHSLVKKLRAVRKAVIFASEAADLRLENRVDKSTETPPLRPGDNVLLYRPQSRLAKTTNMNLIDGYEVIATNNCVVKVKNRLTHQTDWVHRHQIRLVPSRPDHLLDPIPSTRGRYSEKVVDKIGSLKPIKPLKPLKTLELGGKSHNKPDSREKSDQLEKSDFCRKFC